MVLFNEATPVVSVYCIFRWKMFRKPLWEMKVLRVMSSISLVLGSDIASRLSSRPAISWESRYWLWRDLNPKLRRFVISATFTPGHDITVVWLSPLTINLYSSYDRLIPWIISYSIQPGYSSRLPYQEG